MIGRNAYQLLRKLIQFYKVDPNRGIKEWQHRVNQLNGYVLHVPYDALENQNEPRIKFIETNLREILDFALPGTYSNKLFNIDWNIYKKNHSKRQLINW